MDEVHTITEYIAAVRAALLDVPARQREEALAELEELLREDAARRGEQAALEAVGWPRTYANAIRSAIAGEPVDGPMPQGRILGMPYDFRAATVERIADRLWNPGDPRVFMPRLFGVGWTINFGALAVKVGLIRPDDAGDEAFDRAPAAAVRTALAVPAAFAAATVTLVAAAWRSLPAEVPVHWGVSGAPDDWASKYFAFGLLLALTVLPVVATYARILRRGTGARARIFSAAALGLLSALGLGLAAVTVIDASGGKSGGYVWMIIVSGIIVSFLLLYLPVRLGMRAEWQDSLGHPPKGRMR